MTDKPTGPAAAANEIIDAYNLEALTETIEAIILKHCPEDKVGKLVEMLQSIASVQSPESDPRFYELNGGPVGVIARMVEDAQAALADYEEFTK